MLYVQKKSVRGVQNPPKGELSVKNNRAEGYADYKPGMYYISTSQLNSKEIKINANFAKESSTKANRSSIRQDRATARRGYHFKKSARAKEEFFETAIAESTTWWQQEDYQVQEGTVLSTSTSGRMETTQVKNNGRRSWIKSNFTQPIIVDRTMVK